MAEATKHGVVTLKMGSYAILITYTKYTPANRTIDKIEYNNILVKLTVNPLTSMAEKILDWTQSSADSTLWNFLYAD